MVATLVESRTFDRKLEYARDHVLPNIINVAIDSQPGVSLFLGRIANAMFPEMGDSGMGKKIMGGASIEPKIRLGKNTTFKAMTGAYDTFDTTPQDNVRHGRFNWKLYGGTVNISEHEVLTNNSSDAAVADIVQEEMKDAVESAVDLLGTDLYGVSATASQIRGLDELIDANDSVGGLSGATYSNWNSRGVSDDGTAAASVSFAGGSFATVGLANWRRAWNNSSEGLTTNPNAMLTTMNVSEFYESVLEPQHRITNMRLADAGIRALEFKQAPVIPDRKCNSGMTFFLDVGNSIYAAVLEGSDFDHEEWTQPDAQRVRICKFHWTGELCIVDRKRNNKVISQTA